MDEIPLISESIERTALADLHAAAPEETRRDLGLSLENIGAAMVSIARNEPNILLNRAIGLGVEGPDTRETVEAIVSRYAEKGVERYFLHLHPEAKPSGLREWVVGTGLLRARGWMKFHREAAPPPEMESALHVRRIGTDHAIDFGRIVAQCFDLGEAAVPMLSALAERPGWHLYMSFAGGEPAGAGAMFVKDGAAWLDMGATLPAFRRRGGQGAVMRAAYSTP